MREWYTLPYALARSSEATATDLCLLRASCRIVTSFEWCSVQPGVVDMKAFWMILRHCLAYSPATCSSGWLVVNSFPTREVREIGLKFEGSDGSSLAEVFAINLMAAFFHTDGTEEVASSCPTYPAGYQPVRELKNGVRYISYLR